MTTLILNSGHEITIHDEEGEVYISAYNPKQGTGVAVATPEEASLISQIINSAQYAARPKPEGPVQPW